MACPTGCDDDCEATCHETHEVRAKRLHHPCICYLEEAIQEIEYWASYADEYYKEKWGYEDTVTELRRKL